MAYGAASAVPQPLCYLSGVRSWGLENTRIPVYHASDWRTAPCTWVYMLAELVPAELVPAGDQGSLLQWIRRARRSEGDLLGAGVRVGNFH